MLQYSDWCYSFDVRRQSQANGSLVTCTGRREGGVRMTRPLRWPLSSLSLIYGIPSRHADISLTVREHKSSMP